jgi:hypothetical protein
LYHYIYSPERLNTTSIIFRISLSLSFNTYLGLPLSTHKLQFVDFAPIISKSDMCLSGWHGRSLPIGGCLILVNSVLTAMISHAMSAILPVGAVEAFDKRRRAFLWTGEETCNGGQCKVAWPVVCAPKNLGGLGVLSIPARNLALLAKFLTKLHSDSFLRGLAGSGVCMVGTTSGTLVTVTISTPPSRRISLLGLMLSA